MARFADEGPTLVWFRDDLRLADNPALAAACRRDAPVVLLYVHDQESPEIRPLGGAARWWLHHSLASLGKRFGAHGQILILRRGPAEKVVPEVAAATGAAAVCWNRRYGAAAALDERVAAALPRTGIVGATFEANLLFAPKAMRKTAGRPFHVVTAFWRALEQAGEPRRPMSAPTTIPLGVPVRNDGLDALNLLPTRHDWTSSISDAWQPGEPAAQKKLFAFVERLDRYAAERDHPAADATARLSPHLRFGEISPSQVWHAVANAPPSAARDKFLSELGWREFAWHLLDDRPDLATSNLKPAFDDFPWAETYSDAIAAWQRGRTGFPMVDAGMRQLWATGWMHNRARMIAASFLVKHLLADWKIGEQWFWDTLVDADPANNPVNWQWVAGSGADAQPFLRIFNPVVQGEKYDPDGVYVRRWVPELARLPNRFIHAPWAAPEDVLAAAGVRLGDTYPRPIVDHAEARRRALAAFATIQQRQAPGANAA
jgi:deoxyribodipyrimidine photo-lyase